MSDRRPTRGRGALEGLLSDLRARQADRLIPRALRKGRVLDVGCGTTPLFLSRTDFARKYGVDQGVDAGATAAGGPLNLTRLCLAEGRGLPFEDGFFDAVTLLAFIEHVEHDTGLFLLKECRRVLLPGGVIVLTTPSAWTDSLLKCMARAGLVSKEEIDEHRQTFTPESLLRLLVAAGFSPEACSVGKFEWGMNLWARGVK